MASFKLASDNLIITNASYPASGLTVQVGATPVGY